VSEAVTALSNAQELRRELSERNQRYASRHKLPHVLSYGDSPVVVFEPYEQNGAPRHGNFLQATYAAILADRQWQKRLSKAHSQARRSLPRNHRQWRELDTSTSSDALLMNIFCYPRVSTDGRVRTLLGVQADRVPEFGWPARVPLAGNRFDRTEIDMRLGDLLVEAKLTESDFQCKSCEVLERYCDFAEVFEVHSLPRRVWPAISRTGSRAPIAPINPDPTVSMNDRIKASCAGEFPEPDTHTDAWVDPEMMKPRAPEYVSYQLIRNVLAAHATGFSFCVIHDARRPDLREAWYAIMRAIRPPELRTRCKVLTWQELAEMLPVRLQRFLQEKYGIKA
jgi:hypothetical protein